MKIDSFMPIRYIFESEFVDLKLFSPSQKNRKFDLQARLGKNSYTNNSDKRIKFERLPKKKIKPLTWTAAVFIVVLYLFYYLSNI